MLQFHRKFSSESVSSERRRCYRCSRDADGDGVLPAADGARGPWQRTLAGNGCIGRTLAPVLRGRVGIADEGGDLPGGLRHHPSRLLLLHSPCAHHPLCAPAVRSVSFDPAAVLRNHRISPTHVLPVRCCRCAGRGEGGRGEGGTFIAFLGSILGDARRPLSAPCNAQQAVRSGRCAEKLRVCFLA